MNLNVNIFFCNKLDELLLFCVIIHFTKTHLQSYTLQKKTEIVYDMKILKHLTLSKTIIHQRKFYFLFTKSGQSF